MRVEFYGCVVGKYLVLLHHAKSYHHGHAKTYHHGHAKSYHHGHAKSYHHGHAKTYHHKRRKVEGKIDQNEWTLVNKQEDN